MQPQNYSYPPPTAANTSLPSGMSGFQTDRSTTKQSLPCPIREINRRLGRRYTCSGVLADNMSGIRRHLLRNHLDFLKRCPTCNEDFINKDKFERGHGINGEFCSVVRKQRRGVSIEEQWQSLYQKLESRKYASTNAVTAYVIRH
jgi:hypothetical protein